MNQVQMIALLNTLETPCVYDHAKVGDKLPFIAIHAGQPDNFTADNGVYCEKTHFRIDLYTVSKSLKLDYSIKKLLNDNGIAWTMNEQYLNDQSCWETEFEFDVIGDYVPPTTGGDDNGQEG